MKKILLIENNPDLMGNLKLLLEANQYEVLTTNNELTLPIASALNAVDLVICDIELPNLDSFQLNKIVELNFDSQKTPFIFLSAQPDLNDIEKALELGANAIIRKPFHIKDFLNQIYNQIGKNDNQSRSILIVSSDFLTLTNLKSFLIKNNYNTFIAETGEEGFEISKKEKIDLIICDLLNNNFDCCSIIESIKTDVKTREIPFIILGCGGNGIDFRKAMNLGAVNYFPKPVDLFSLLTSLELKISEQYSNLQKYIRKETADTFKILNTNSYRRKILLIEDSTSLVELLSIQLKQYGLDVISTMDGQIGIEMAIREKPDLIICDVLLPEINGYNVLSVLKKEKTTSRIPFFFLTGKSDFSDIRKGMNQGADDYFIKPVEIAELIKAINNILGTNYSINIPNKDDIKKTENKIVINDLFPLSAENLANNIVDNARLKLDSFMKMKNSHNDYESMFYNGIEIIKININNAMDNDTQKFYRYIFEKIDEKKHIFLIDLRSIEFITSSFIGVIISAQRKLNFVGGYICLVFNPKSNNNLMIFQNLSRVIEIYEDFNKALDEMLD